MSATQVNKPSNSTSESTSAKYDPFEEAFEEDLAAIQLEMANSASLSTTMSEFSISELCELHRLFRLKFQRQSLDTNVLSFWATQDGCTQLAVLAKIILNTPGTQVSVERLFSLLKWIVSDLRMSLTAKNIDNILLLVANKDHILN